MLHRPSETAELLGGIVSAFLCGLRFRSCHPQAGQSEHLPERRGITAVIGDATQNHANAHSDVVVLYPSSEVKAVAVRCDLHFLLVFRIGGTGQQWP